ncbi:MAG: choice-of-anchor D domain-containing protein [bacterium]
MRIKVGEHLPCGSNNCDETAVPVLPYQKVASGKQRSILHGGAGTDYVRSAAIGDLNGDSINDLAIGVTDYKDENVDYSTGAVFIKFGPIGGITGIEWGGSVQSIDLSHPEGGWDVKIIGDPDDRHEGNNTRRIGNSIAIGDIDGDGIADLIIGTTDQDEDGNHTPNIQWTPVSEPGHVPGKAYVIYGKRENWEKVYRLGNEEYDLKIYGDQEDEARELGYQVAVGRFFCDESMCPELQLVISAPTNPNEDPSKGKTGRVYILGGFHNGLPKEIRTDKLRDHDLRVTLIESKYYVENDVKIIDEFNFDVIDHIGDGLGKAIAVGDIDGDGLDDLVMGAPHYSRLARTNPLTLEQGAVYVLFGGIDLQDLIVADPDGRTSGSPRVITGPQVLVRTMSRTGFGSSVVIVDLDNDGKGEIIIGAPRSDLELTIYADPTLSDSEQTSISKKESWIGSVYVIDGSKTINFTKDSIDNISDIIVHGSKTMSLFGYSLAGGDVNNDGKKDLLVGAPGKPLSGVPGRVWVLFGSREPKWRLTEGFDTIHLKHRRWYVTSNGMIFHPRNPNTKIEEGIDSVFIGDVNSVDRMGLGFGIHIVVGDLDPFVGDDVVILDRFGKGPQQGDWSMGPGAAYVFYQVGELLPLTIYPETVKIPYCDSEQRFTVTGGLMPYQFKWDSCYQTYVGQPPVQFPGPIVCGEEFALPSNFEVTYGENSAILRINECVPNDLMSLSLKVTDSAIPHSSATREITFLKPDIFVSPFSISFGDVPIGYTVNIPITVSNSGNMELQIESVSITGSGDIRYINNCPQTIQPQGSCTIEAIFNPTVQGPATATISITSNDPDEATVNINLTGNGVGVPPIIAGSALTSFRAAIGGSSSHDFEYWNIGGSDLLISNVSISGPPFYITADTCTGRPITPYTPYSFDYCVITVMFKPTDTSYVSGTITIESNDPYKPVLRHDLSGVGIASYISVTPVTMDFGSTSTTATLTVQNTSAYEYLNWRITNGLPSWLSVSQMSGEMDPGTSTTLTVTVNRTGLQPGTYLGDIYIASNGGDRGVAVRMNVPAFISVSPSSLDFAEAKKRLELTIRNTNASTPLTWSIASDLPSWLTASQMNGEIPPGGNARIYLYADRSGLYLDQTYAHTLSISSNGGDASVPVSMTVPIPLATFAKYYGGDGGEYFSKIRPTSDGGFIAVGVTNSFGAGPMGSTEDAWVVKLDSSGYVEWERTYGGYWYPERAYDVRETPDGGYIVVCGTMTFTSDHSYGLWILKLDAYGDVEWEKEYGGEVDDNWGDWGMEFSVQQTNDNGYIVAGNTWKTPSGQGQDVWVLKLNSFGEIQWQKTYGGTSDDYANSIKQTSDGGYIVAGVTRSLGAGEYDIWVLKLDSDGDIQWQKTYGGADWDLVYEVQQTQDGGYVVAGTTWSTTSAWVLKLDSSGNIEWQKTYGGYGSEYYGSYGHSIKQTSDGGYILSGVLSSRVSGDDIWVVKLDSSGDVEWQKSYGGSGIDVAYSIEEISESGYAISGYTTSFRSTPGRRQYDAFVMKIDSIGNIGASCALMDLTSMTTVETSISAVDTTVTPQDSTETGRVTAATVGDSSAVVEAVCSETIPEAGQRPLIDIDVSPLSHDFGEVMVGEEATQVFTVRNSGYQPLNIVNILISGSMDFTATHNCPISPDRLDIARRCEITVSFSPSTEGPQGAYLWIQSNDPDESLIEISITGTGYMWEECPPEECPEDGRPPGGLVPMGGR